MIKIPINEGIIFDMLAILEVKKNINNNISNTNNYNNMINDISKEIGHDLLSKILDSEEYSNLLSSNLNVFNLVSLAQKDNGLAKAVDEANYQRYLHKSKLQEKFFNSKNTEIKIGYN